MSFRLLLVDDEESLVWSLQQSLQRERPHWALEAFSDPQAALRRVRAAPPDVLVTDVRMPGLSGTDLLLAAREVAPSLPVVVLTAYGTPEIAALLDQRTGVVYLEKPVDFAQLLRAIDRLLADRAGFSGAISLPMLPDLLQIYTLSRSTVALTVTSPEGVGTIWIERGEIVHAECGARIGEEAVYELLAWSGGGFTLQIDAIAERSTISAGWQELLLEGYRRLDEGRRDRAAAAPPVPPRTLDADPTGLLAALAGSVPGLIAAAVLDPASGRALGEVGSAARLDGHSLVVAGGRAGSVEDALLTFDDELHFFRVLPSGHVLALAAERAAAVNLASLRSSVARHVGGGGHPSTIGGEAAKQESSQWQT